MSNFTLHLAEQIGGPRTPLSKIDSVVAKHLGPARVPGNAQPNVLYRQIAMYLAKHVGRWSTTQIGRFYNGRDHSTVCHAIQRIESLRRRDSSADALIVRLMELCRTGNAEPVDATARVMKKMLRDPDDTLIAELADRIADRIVTRLQLGICKANTCLQEGVMSEPPC